MAQQSSADERNEARRFHRARDRHQFVIARAWPSGRPTVPLRIAVEAAAPQSWYRWVGDRGVVMGIERFGASAPYQRIYQELGLTVERIVAEAKRLV